MNVRVNWLDMACQEFKNLIVIWLRNAQVCRYYAKWELNVHTMALVQNASTPASKSFSFRLWSALKSVLISLLRTQKVVEMQYIFIINLHFTLFHFCCLFIFISFFSYFFCSDAYTYTRIHPNISLNQHSR